MTSRIFSHPPLAFCMEGPEVRIAAEDMADFRGRLIREAHGNAKIDMGRIQGNVLRDVFNRGKQLMLDLGSLHIRVHFMMFGSYRVNEERSGPDAKAGPRLRRWQAAFLQLLGAAC